MRKLLALAVALIALFLVVKTHHSPCEEAPLAQNRIPFQLGTPVPPPVPHPAASEPTMAPEETARDEEARQPQEQTAEAIPPQEQTAEAIPQTRGS